jgi:hypothetical protein
MDITVELNGIKYLVVEELATTRNQEEITAKVKKHEAIYQGIKQLNTGGFWGSSYGVIKILVPEKNIVAYNNEGY